MEEQQDEGSEASASQDPSRNEYAVQNGLCVLLISVHWIDE